MNRWYKIDDSCTKNWNDDGYFYCKDFEHFYISVHRTYGVWQSKLVDQHGCINSEKHGQPAKTLRSAKKNAERLALTALEKLAQSLGYEIRSLK